MYNLGKWSPFINQAEMFSWYQLHPETAHDCAGFQPTGYELEPIVNFDVVYTQFVDYVQRSVANTTPAYHNDRMHFAAAERDGLHALDAYAHYRPRSVPEVVRQMSKIGFRGHDAFHCAATFRAQARNQERLPLPHFGHRVSSEWVTAYANDQFLSRHSVPMPARLYQIYIAWSSTYGANTPLGIELQLPQPRPTRLGGVIMRACDVCTPEDPYTWLRQAIALNYGEVPATPPAESWVEFVAKERAFASYIEFTLDELDAVAQMDLSEEIGWRRRLVQRQDWVDDLLNRRTQIHRFAEAELFKYGFVLL